MTTLTRFTLVILVLALVAPAAVLGADGGSRWADRSGEASLEDPCPVPTELGKDFAGPALGEICMAGCTIALDTNGVGATCSCSATGRGASCTRQTNQGGNTETVTCTDAAGTIRCAYNRNGTACACA